MAVNGAVVHRQGAAHHGSDDEFVAVDHRLRLGGANGEDARLGRVEGGTSFVR
jgi:hypothetical protein